MSQNNDVKIPASKYFEMSLENGIPSTLIVVSILVVNSRLFLPNREAFSRPSVGLSSSYLRTASNPARDIGPQEIFKAGDLQLQLQPRSKLNLGTSGHD